MSARNYHVLIVDDDLEFHKDTRFALRHSYEFDGALDIQQFRQKLRNNDHSYDLILLDLVLDPSGRKAGLELIPEISSQYPGLPIVIVTSDSKVDTVVKAMQLGASDYLYKGDLDYDLWSEKFRKIINNSHIKAENQTLRENLRHLVEKESKAFSFIGESAKIKEIKHLLRILSEQPDVTVLLTGETGVGKEVAARYLHNHGARKNRPFFAINLSAIPENLLESELFGHVKGAFTGAAQDKKGYFRQADGGIILLDEIGDINANLQIKLLRLLEQKLIRPIGSDKDIQLDIQILVATHYNLLEEVEKGKFREDLYQRLKNMVVLIPPLRERREDIVLILEHYLSNKYGLPLDVIEPEALQRLQSHYWRGNVRELVNTIDQMCLKMRLWKKNRADLDCLPSDILQFSAPEEEQSEQPFAQSLPDTPEETSTRIYLQYVEKTLKEKNKVKKDVASALGLTNSDMLRYKIQSFYSKFPHLFDSFPLIRESYPKIFGKGIGA